MTRIRATSLLASISDAPREAILRWAAEASGATLEFIAGHHADRQAAVRTGGVDLAFVCGGLYVDWADAGVDLTPVLAPAGEQGAVYESWAVTRPEHMARSLGELCAMRVAINETQSHSGYRMLVRRLGSPARLGHVVATGSHRKSLEAVAGGAADVAAIDSTVYQLEGRAEPALVAGLDVVERLGPDPSPPLVVVGKASGAVLRCLAVLEQTPGSLCDGLCAVQLASVDADTYAPLRDARVAVGAAK